MIDRPLLLVIAGPTAVGKTALSLVLAERLGGEVVSADSRLFYRGMDIGTAKPSLEERSRVPHHLIDIADPDDTVGLARFQELAHAAIMDISARRQLPLLVGGTGQYVRAVTEGWSPPPVPPQMELRRELEEQARQEGAPALHARLAVLDPEAAARIDPRNMRRVIRALEVCLVTGQRFSSLRSRTDPPYCSLQVGLTTDRQALYARVDARIEAMMAAGLPDEVQRLRAAGYGWDLPSMSGLGYAQFRPYFQGQATLEDVAAAIKQATRRFIRHQYAWFRLDDPRIEWFDVTEHGPVAIAAHAQQWLSRTASGDEVGNGGTAAAERQEGGQ